MFAAGFAGALWLVGLALVVARFYGTWRRWDGWAELHQDGATVARVIKGGHLSGSSKGIELVAIGAMVGWSAAWAAFLYALSS